MGPCPEPVPEPCPEPIPEPCPEPIPEPCPVPEPVVFDVEPCVQARASASACVSARAEPCVVEVPPCYGGADAFTAVKSSSARASACASASASSDGCYQETFTAAEGDAVAGAEAVLF